MGKQLRIIQFVLFMVSASKICYAQKNYFYTSLKVPLFEYIGYAVNSNTDNKTDGILMDAGYGINLTRRFVIETGIEYFIFNPYEKEYYTNQNIVSNAPFAELHVKNSAFGFQARPVLKTALDVNENTTLRIACAINYQKAFSNGYYYSNQDQSLPLNPENKKEDQTETNFFFAIQPALGIEFKVNDNLGLGFDFAYIKTNWNKSMSQLRFPNQPNLIIPEHKTSNVFIAGRIIFR